MENRLLKAIQEGKGLLTLWKELTCYKSYVCDRIKLCNRKTTKTVSLRYNICMFVGNDSRCQLPFVNTLYGKTIFCTSTTFVISTIIPMSCQKIKATRFTFF